MIFRRALLLVCVLLACVSSAIQAQDTGPTAAPPAAVITNRPGAGGFGGDSGERTGSPATAGKPGASNRQQGQGFGPAREAGRQSASESAAADKAKGIVEPQRLPEREAPNEFQEFVASSIGRSLPMFGYSLFDAPPSTFAPLEHVPVTPDYVIGPGDEIAIRAWGQLDVDYLALVDRSGQIHIPQVGTLTVAGLRYQDLNAFIRSAISRVFRNFELSVTLGALRSIQVFVVGHARRPGAYTVSSLSTLVNALFFSGGPSSTGSMRRIQLKRRDAVVSQFDVYDLLRKGDKSNDARLQPGDVIYIPPVGELVAVAGSVNQPAIYELNGETSLRTVISLAGGLSTVAAGQKASVERIFERRARRVDDFTLDQAGLDRKVRDGDLVQIHALSPRFDNAVTLRGSVAAPGRFPWREGMRVQDVIPTRESLIVLDFWQRQNAAPRKPLAISPEPRPESRASERTLEGRSVDTRGADDPDKRPRGEGERSFRTEVKRTYEEVNWDYAVIERLDYENLTTMLIPFNLGRAIIDGDPTHNLQLRPGDVVTVFSKADILVPVAKQTKFVRLEGEVRTPGVYQVLPGETLRQLVTRVGGFTPNAYLYGSEFTRETVRVQQQKRYEEALDRLSQEIERTASEKVQAGADTGENIQAATENQRKLVGRMREVKAVGRIVLEVRPDRIALGDLPEMPLEDGDRLIIPARPATVHVMGAVYNQTSFLYDRGKGLSDYLEQAGGLTRSADKGYTYLVRADGSVTGRAHGGFFALLPNKAVNPGDTIVVPETLDRFYLSKQLKEWTQILYQLALGVAGLKVLRDF